MGKLMANGEALSFLTLLTVDTDSVRRSASSPKSRLIISKIIQNLDRRVQRASAIASIGTGISDGLTLLTNSRAFSTTVNSSILVLVRPKVRSRFNVVV